jgi:hypothetical protein
MTPAPARVKELIAVGMYAHRHYQLGFVAPPAPRSSLRIHAIASKPTARPLSNHGKSDTASAHEI